MAERVGVEIVDGPRQARTQDRVFLFAQPYVALAQGFHGIEHVFAGLRGEHFAQQVAEQAHAGAQLLVARGWGHAGSNWHIHLYLWHFLKKRPG